ncbi:MAG: AMP-binding protein, partial [Bacillota bacterium]|nr:AMP-binding protein [Bacillota bacterium]
MLEFCQERYSEEIAFKYRNKPRSEVICKTYTEFANDTRALGSALHDLRLKGCHIAIIGENRYEWVVSYLATVNGIGVAVPLDKMLPENEIITMLDRGDVDVLIYSSSF